MTSPDVFKDLLNSVPSHVQIRWANVEGDGKLDPDTGEEGVKCAVVVLSFSASGFGFGELTFVQDEHGQLYLDTECIGRKKVMEFLQMWVDSAITDSETDPGKHARYNEVHGRSCGSHCKICFEQTTE
jgi:hypothetical protein